MPQVSISQDDSGWRQPSSTQPVTADIWEGRSHGKRVLSPRLRPAMASLRQDSLDGVHVPEAVLSQCHLVFTRAVPVKKSWT